MAFKNIKPKKRKEKLNLVFDETKRRDFLKGFRKRKLQRQKKAQEELQEKLKAEKRRIKQESKESYKKLVVSYKPIPELDDLMKEECEDDLMKEEYEDENVTVKIVELSTNEIAEKSHWIGQNVSKESESASEKVESSDSECSNVELPGMELKQMVRNKTEVTQEKNNTPVFKTKKEISKHIMKQATRNVKKSKVFQAKNKQERLKNKKKSMLAKHKREKFLEKKSKQRHKGKQRGRQ